MLNHFHNLGSKNQPENAHSGSTQVGSMQGWGKIYDPMVTLTSLGQEHRLRNATLALAQIRPGERVLEVGCGTGSLAIAAKKQQPQAQVTGADIASDMIERARAKARKAGLALTFQVGRMEALPFADAQFDVVLSSLMLHHIPGDAAKLQGLREVLRVLKPGGRVVIVDMARPRHGWILWIGEKVFGQHMLARSLDEFTPLLRQAGFSEIASGATQSSFLDYLRGTRPQAQSEDGMTAAVTQERRSPSPHSPV